MVSGVWGWLLISRLSSSELQERRDGLRSSLLGFRAGLVETVLTGVSEFQPWSQGPPSSGDSRQQLAERFARYRSAGGARLVSGLAVITRTETGVRLERLVTSNQKFEVVEWPSELASLRNAIEARAGSDPRPSGPPPGFGLRLSGAQPVLVIPFGGGFMRGGPVAGFAGIQGPAPSFGLAQPGPPGAPPDGQLSGPPGEARPLEPGFPPADNRVGPAPLPQPAVWCVLMLDVQTLSSTVMPELIDRHFKARERDFSLVVFCPQTGRTIFRWGPSIETNAGAPYDASIRLNEDRRRMFVERFAEPGTRIEPASVETAQDSQFPDGWVLAARHRSGPLEEVVERERRRSLALAFGLLAAVGISGVMLVWSARRARELARRQMEFVAGVSHELLTPVSIIRTAASNLSRGVVHDGAKTAEYGRLLEKEGLRLSKMVRQVLDFAGLQAENRVYRPEEIDISAVLKSTLAEYRPLLEQDGWQVEEDIQEVGAVDADLQSIESCLTNLIDNATKYASAGKWIRITASRDAAAAPAVKVTVEDRGPGIAPEDVPYIFEPFYRGRGFAASRLPGAGLGLSIVRRHMEAIGGRASVSCAQAGCVFTLLFPASHVEEGV